MVDGIEMNNEYHHNFDKALIEAVSSVDKAIGDQLKLLLENKADIEMFRKFLGQFSISITRTHLRDRHQHNTEDFVVNVNGIVREFSIPSRFKRLKDEIIEEAHSNG